MATFSYIQEPQEGVFTTKVQDPHGQETTAFGTETFSYDISGRLISVSCSDQTGNCLSQTSRYYNLNGQVTWEQHTQHNHSLAVETWTQNILSVDPTNAAYQTSRSMTSVGLEIGSFVVGGYGAVKGAMALPKLFRAPAQALKVISSTEQACNRATHELYKINLRKQMERPFVKDSQLNTYFDLAYRPKGSVGNGSTGAAIRYEMATGEKVKGKQHTQKGWELINALEKWMKKNPTAPSAERAAAENVIKDLYNSLGY